MEESCEEIIVRALDASSPSEVVHSERMLASFRAFIARGSVKDTFLLFPRAEFSISTPLQSNSNRAHAHLTKLPGALANNVGQGKKSARQANWRSYSAKLGELSVPVDVADAWSFFAERVVYHQRIQGLMRVLEGILKAPHPPHSFYHGIWSGHEHGVFETSSPSDSRIVRLFRGRKLIDQEYQRFECAGRLSLIFLTHDIEVIKEGDWKLSPGQSRQNAAVESIAEHLDVHSDEIRKEWRRSRNYMKLLEEYGPGSLLELGSGVNWYWEKALTKTDVTVFIDFCEKRTPGFAKRAQSLNMTAGIMILQGMLAYGWTEEAILNTQTRVRNALALHCPSLLPFSCQPTATDQYCHSDPLFLNQAIEVTAGCESSAEGSVVASEANTLGVCSPSSLHWDFSLPGIDMSGIEIPQIEHGCSAVDTSQMNLVDTVFPGLDQGYFV